MEARLDCTGMLRKSRRKRRFLNEIPCRRLENFYASRFGGKEELELIQFNDVPMQS